MPEAAAQGFGALLDQVYATGKPCIGRNMPFPIDEPGSPGVRYLDLIYQPMRGMEGAVEGILVLGTDGTDGYRPQQLLIETEKLAAVGRMMSTIAHEINNPLEAVTNLIYIARQDSASEDVVKSLDLADEELRRIAAITSQTLSFHRQLTSAKPVSRDDFFAGSLLIYGRRIRSHGVAIERRERATQTVRCCEGEIRQVMNNLIGNALDALGPEGRVLVRSADATDLRTGRRGVRLTVADSGSGIAPAELGRVFDPFFTTKGMMGSGLGLWVSRPIVERHGGGLLVRSSRCAGRNGTVFQIFLPLDPGGGELHETHLSQRKLALRGAAATLYRLNAMHAHAHHF